MMKARLAITLTFALFTLVPATGCFREQPAATTIDLSEVPERVALLAPAEGLSINFGTVPQGSSRDIPLHIINAGPTPAHAFAVKTEPSSPFTFKGGSFPGTGGDCAKDVEPSAMCTLVLTYAPASPGPHSAKLALEYMNGMVLFPLELMLDGTTAGTLTFNPSGPLDFGTRLVGSSTLLEVTVTNSGVQDAESIAEAVGSELAAPFSFSGGSFPGTAGTCTDSLAAGANCKLELRFNPATPGVSADDLSLQFMTGGLPQVATLALKGSTPALLQISNSPSHDFERHVGGSSTDVVLTVTNAGGVAATAIQESAAQALAAPFSFKDGAFPGTGGTCTATLDPAASCTTVATFSPALVASADYSDDVTLSYHDGKAATQVTRTLRGRGQLNWDSSAAATSPTARHLHSSIWTGNEMIIWGGEDATERFSDGAKYDPVKDQWTSIAGSGLVGRIRHSAVWASNLAAPKMIIWGGQRDNGNALTSGAMYDPALDEWTSMSTVGAPSARYGHTAVWDPVHRKMIVWGGASAAIEATRGYLFDPELGVGGTWTQISEALAGTPAARYHHTAVWTGSKMIIWGGCLAKNGSDTCQIGSETNTGAIFDPAGAGTWTPIAAAAPPTARFLHSAIWTGSKMVIFGGATDTTGNGGLTPMNSGSFYRLPENGELWSATPALNAPSARAGHLSFWTTKGLIIWGGLANSGAGSILDATLTTWAALPGGAPTETSGTSGVYTAGNEARMIVFGGMGAGPIFSSSAAVLVP